MDWKTLERGDKVTYYWDSFDGRGCVDGEVVVRASDHAIVLAEDMNLWMDEFNQDMFRKKE